MSSDVELPLEATPVLVVDDNDLVRNFIARVLAGAGFAPVVAFDGPDALRHAAAMTSCHVLVTDVVMPGMSGPQLVHELRQGNPHLKVLYLSGLEDRPHSDRAEDQTDEMFLEKPMSPDALVAAVKTLLAGHPPG